MENRPLFMESIEEIIETAFRTSSIEGAVPQSLLLVADQGTGKSKVIERYNLNPKEILITDSFSANGLYELMSDDRENKLRFIIVPDLNLTMSRRHATVESAMASLLSVTSDGTTRIDDGRREKVCLHRPVGLLTACTPDVFRAKSKKWFQLGLKRRIIPIFFKYGAKTVDNLLDSVEEGKITSKNYVPCKIEFSEGYHSPTISASNWSAIRAQARNLASNLGLNLKQVNLPDGRKSYMWIQNPMMPVSPEITLKSLIQAHAFLHKRGTVSQEDVKFGEMFVSFTNQQEIKEL